MTFTDIERREFLQGLGLVDNPEPEVEEEAPVAQVVDNAVQRVEDLVFKPEAISGFDVRSKDGWNGAYRTLFDAHKRSRHMQGGSEWNKALHRKVSKFVSDQRPKTSHVKEKVKEHAKVKNEEIVEGLLQTLVERAEERGIDLSSLLEGGE